MSKDLVTREKLIEAYLALAMKEGLENVTYQKVATKAKVAFGTVRYHFADTDLDLLQSAVVFVAQKGQLFIERYLEKQRREVDFDPVKSYIEGTFEWIGKHRKHASFLVLFYYTATTDRKMAISNERFLSTALTRIKSLALEGAALGIYASIPNDSQIVAIHSAIVGGCIMAMSERQPDSILKYAGEIAKLAALILPKRA